jgi:hypothetical protein
MAYPKIRAPKTNSWKRVILLISGSCLISACATFIACRAEDYIKVYGFNLDTGSLYLGAKEKPDEVIPLNDPKLEKQMVAMHLKSWTYVKNRLAACK